jgi:hypothetical protein
MIVPMPESMTSSTRNAPARIFLLFFFIVY